jgi:DnaJ-domain-containing protein 1
MVGVLFAIGFLSDSNSVGLILLSVLLFIPFFAIQIKRSRDIGWSGWFSLVSLIPIASFIWLIALGLKKGKKDENSFHSERAEESNQEHEGSNFKQEEQKKGNDRFHNRASERIIACPSCKQKIRFKVPLNRDIGKCKKCSSRFELHMDESGHIHITKLDEKEKYHDSENEIKNIENCFEILEINQNSTPTEIKSAYRKKMMEYHPDKVEKLGSKLKIIAEEESKKFNTAYSTLKENGYL